MGKFWFTYIGTFAVFTLVMQIGESSASLLAAADLNDTTAFQVDKIGSGSGFFSTIRNMIDAFTDFIPKVITFNYSFLQGDMELIRWFLAFVWGGTLVFALFINRMLGVNQRNV